MMGSRRELYKKLDGILALWKPTGITSAQFCNHFKKAIQKELSFVGTQDIKIGHGGTLDMSASGVLVVGLGRGCKLLKHLLSGSKMYHAVGCLGMETTTYNEEGDIVDKKPYDHVTFGLIKQATKQFHGRIMQSPPEYSALKLDGVRLSDIVMEGYSVPEEKLKPRPVHVYSIDILDFSPPLITVDIQCGAGFYIRSFIHDLGKALNTCAYLHSLERRQHGPFSEQDVLPETHWTYPEILNELARTAEITRNEWKSFKTKRKH